jgi:predicted transposase/invertase (TIGR01784 family)
MATKKLVRFDWAMKYLLKKAANLPILSGFLSELLGEHIRIIEVLDYDRTEESYVDEYNRIDLLIANADQELIIVEIQDRKEYDYFRRIISGTNRVVTRYIQEKTEYHVVKRVISVAIVYFKDEFGADYLYHGTNILKGINKNDSLTFSKKQANLHNQIVAQGLFSEYWMINIHKFGDLIQNPFDEWIFFFKHTKMLPNFSAQGLPLLANKLNINKFSGDSIDNYRYFLEKLHDIASYEYNRKIEEEERMEEVIERKFKEAEKKGMENNTKETILKLHHKGKSPQEISDLLDLSIEYVTKAIHSTQ